MLHRFKNGIICVSAVAALSVYSFLSKPPSEAQAALYLQDKRRAMQEADYKRYVGAGVLFCRDANHVPRKAASAWLIGTRRLVLMNAHNFRDKHGLETRPLDECHFQINGKNYGFAAESLHLGISRNMNALHITDDWALALLKTETDTATQPQRLPSTVNMPVGPSDISVTMVSPASHANFNEDSSIESCAIRFIDSPSEDDIRRARHNCNDGFGGSGSGLFDEGGRMIAMQSASLDMNRRLAFDVEAHYGSALLIEGELVKAIEDLTTAP